MRDVLIRPVAIAKLKKTGKFDEMDLETDSDEHSLEMHLPYLRLMFQNSCVLIVNDLATLPTTCSPDMQLVPLLVGNVSEATAAEYAQVFQEYWNDEQTFWVISSDFCHW